MSRSLGRLTSRMLLSIRGRDRTEICPYCEWTGEDYPELIPKHSLDTWAESARHGCPICAIVVSVAREVQNHHGINFGTLIRFSGGFTAHNFGRFSISSGDDAGSSETEETEVLVYNEHGSTTPIKGIGYSCSVSKNAGSQECMELIKSWLSTCLLSHPICRQDSTPNLPTRVLDITSESPRLIVTNSQVGNFVALSHCWGASQPLRTELNNIQSHMNGILFASLPVTFQDAIKVTRMLDIQYLWIDSLCIIQDDLNDWEQEAAKMASVYGNALLVIGAASSDGCQKGFLGERPMHFEGTVYVPSPDHRKRLSPIRYHRVIRHIEEFSTRPVAEGPLETRAWTFQERRLARRYISFGVNELYWECKTLGDCECDWSNQRSGQSEIDKEWAIFRPINLDSKLEHMSEADLCHDWRVSIVTPYSQRNITRASDKFVALSAVVSTYQRLLNDQYLAGLWKKNLVRDLLWHREEETTIADSGAPSWSWASITGTVRWLLPLKHVNLVAAPQLIDATCTPTTGNPFGDVTDAKITLRAKFAAATAVYDPNGVISSEGWQRCYTLKEFSCGQQTRFDVHLETVNCTMPDEMTKRTARRRPGTLPHPAPSVRAEHPVWCILLGTCGSKTSGNAIILILGICEAQPAKFERLGIADLDLGSIEPNEIFGQWEVKVVTIV